MNEVVEETEMWLKEELDLVSIEEVGEYVVIRPKAYLPKPDWDRINNTVREHGGEYVSAGKESHWKRRKNTPQDLNENVQKAYELIEQGLIKLKEAGCT